MYPDWPEPGVPLLPLPRCFGPKLKPFDFQGPQEIEFLSYLGEGLHSHVIKIKIHGQIYALKLFRFVHDCDWLGSAEDSNPNDLAEMSAFYNFSEPFSAECRAFGRLEEVGRRDLAIRCYGYIFLDEKHERALQDLMNLDLEGNNEYPTDDLRSRFVGKNGRAPPVRCIVKEFGRADEDLRNGSARRILRDVVQLQQLGIIHIDVGHRQLINGKLADFSTAMTTPHYIINAEMNPLLKPAGIAALEFETFQFSINDYWYFDEMILEWNEEHEDPKDQVSVFAFSYGQGWRRRYNLRRTPNRDRVYSLVDPRKFYPQVYPPLEQIARARRGDHIKPPPGGVPKRRRLRVDAKPPRWYYDCDSAVAADLKSTTQCSTSLEWNYKNGLFWPKPRR
ncbi:hypothetical protein G7Z17_g6076 [Cylindrodendrum hubeiense]|uniref:Protein kinase domain-containing protein n=1 Tax=Cylindrodendrum hubeiense TaxID=595255 RepID=A0A9P5H603_9HYPO|nr:hypothetical protein G7Z17_g6076 [Cylindrodendrum hubeiense]